MQGKTKLRKQISLRLSLCFLSSITSPFIPSSIELGFSFICSCVSKAILCLVRRVVQASVCPSIPLFTYFSSLIFHSLTTRLVHFSFY